MVNIILIKTVTVHKGKTIEQWIDFNAYKKKPARTHKPLLPDSMKAIVSQPMSYTPPKNRKGFTGGADTPPVTPVTPVPIKSVTKEELEKAKKRQKESDAVLSGLIEAHKQQRQQKLNYSNLRKRHKTQLKKHYFIVPDEHTTHMSEYTRQLFRQMFDHSVYTISATNQMFKIKSFSVDGSTMFIPKEIQTPQLLLSKKSGKHEKALKKIADKVRLLIPINIVNSMQSTDRIFVFTINIHLDDTSAPLIEKMKGHCGYHVRKFWDAVNDLKPGKFVDDSSPSVSPAVSPSAPPSVSPSAPPAVSPSAPPAVSPSAPPAVRRTRRRRTGGRSDRKRHKSTMRKNRKRKGRK